MSNVIEKYAAALLPFAVLIIGASQTILHHPTNWNADISYGVLVLGAVVTYIVPLAPVGWQGRFKTGIAIVTTILSALLPFVLPGGFDPAISVPIIFVAILNAISTQLGVNIRVGATNVATS